MKKPKTPKNPAPGLATWPGTGMTAHLRNREHESVEGKLAVDDAIDSALKAPEDREPRMTAAAAIPQPVPMPTAQQMAIIDLTEDVATWLETCARGGRLFHRLQMADQLRSGAWRSMRQRRGAPGDVARARVKPGAAALQAHALRPLERAEDPLESDR